MIKRYLKKKIAFFLLPRITKFYFAFSNRNFPTVASKLVIFFTFILKERRIIFLPDPEYQSSRNITKLRHQSIIKVIKGLDIDTGGKVLDVGCGEKQLLLQEMSNIWEFNFQGCDWKKIFSPKFKYDVLDLDKEGLKEYSNKFFDLIICSDVLEHLESPSSLLSEISLKMKDEGVLIVTIPNIENLYERYKFFYTCNFSRYKKEKKNGFGHISIFTSNTFTSLLARHQLQVKKAASSTPFFFGYLWPLKGKDFSYNRLYVIEKKLTSR